jgi:hypothetical protein
MDLKDILTLVIASLGAAAPGFKSLRGLIEEGPAEAKALANVTFEDKRDYLGFFQELALVVKSKLIKTDVAYYMLGTTPCAAMTTQRSGPTSIVTARIGPCSPTSSTR